MESAFHLNIFKKKEIVIVNVLPKLQTVKDSVSELFKKRCSRTSFDSQHVKGFQTLVKSSWDHFHHIFPLLWGEIIWKASPLLKFEMIGVFVKTWTADYKYPLSDFENFRFPIQMKLSEKSKRISQFFVQLVESTFNLSIFRKTILS